MNGFATILRWPGRVIVAILIAIIRVYQVTLSPLLGPACRFEPSCSRYMAECLKKYGLLRGLARGLRRVSALPPLGPGRLRPSLRARRSGADRMPSAGPDRRENAPGSLKDMHSFAGCSATSRNATIRSILGVGTKMGFLQGMPWRLQRRSRRPSGGTRMEGHARGNPPAPGSMERGRVSRPDRPPQPAGRVHRRLPGNPADAYG